MHTNTGGKPESNLPPLQGCRFSKFIAYFVINKAWNKDQALSESLQRALFPYRFPIYRLNLALWKKALLLPRESRKIEWYYKV